MKRLIFLLLTAAAYAQIPGYSVPVTGIGFNVCIGSGSNTFSGAVVKWPLANQSGCVNITAKNATTYGYLDPTTGALSTNTTGPPNNSCPIFEADTNFFQVTKVRDVRPSTCGGAPSGGGGLTGCSQPQGGALNCTVSLQSGGDVQATTNVTAGGNVTAANMTASSTVTGQTVHSNGDVTASNNVTGNNVTASSTVSGVTVSGTNVTASSAVSGGTVSASSTVSGATVSSSGDVNFAANLYSLTVGGALWSMAKQSGVTWLPDSSKFAADVGCGSGSDLIFRCYDKNGNLAINFVGISGQASAGQIPDLSGTYVTLTQINAANGVAGLNASALLPWSIHDGTEGPDPACTVGVDNLLPTTSGHRFKMCNNNGGVDTVAGAATTDTFTNKTWDTGGTGNSFKIAGKVVVNQTGANGANFTVVGNNDPTVSALEVTNKIGATVGYNGSLTVGQGVVPIRAMTSQKSENASDPNVLTLTPPAVAGSYRLRITVAVSAQNTATLGWTATWKDANGTVQAPTNLSLFKSGTAAPALTFTAATNDNYYGYADIDINNSATNIVIQLTFTGTSFTAKVSASIEQIN